ncbi:MAG TPA: hypothetical protein PLB45_04050 [Bacilli bacterium]|jgi:hypothetical protein|nr:hypothetical protein [Bacilli bacterium]HPZ23936.1 hypothetical protein [Bacilli bacterium]HQC84024.1 hypothetical protein [Bacilli bacterium]
MLERQEAFNDYIEEFRKLTLDEKKNELELTLIDLGNVLQKLCESSNLDFKLLYNSILTSKNSNPESMDDYLTRLLIYSKNIEEQVGILTIQ